MPAEDECRKRYREKLVSIFEAYSAWVGEHKQQLADACTVDGNIDFALTLEYFADADHVPTINLDASFAPRRLIEVSYLGHE